MRKTSLRSAEIKSLIDAVELAYGPITLDGSFEDEEHGTCFILGGIPAAFSVLTLEGTLPPGQFNIQIESVPPGYYLYMPEKTVSIEELIDMIAKYRRPQQEWPQ